MEFGISVSTFPTRFGPLMFSGNLQKHIGEMARLGYAGFDLFIKHAGEEGLKPVLAAVQASGMRIFLLAAVSSFVDEGLFLSSPDALVRSKLVERMKKQVDLAAELGAGVPVGVIRGSQAGEDRLLYLAESLHTLDEYAALAGVKLLLEPVNRYETRLINTAQEALSFLNEHGLDRVGLLLDIFHMNIEEDSIEKAILSASSRLGHVHLADSNRKVPGKGHIPWESVFRALDTANYTRTCSIEAFPGSAPQQDAADAIAFLRQVAFRKETPVPSPSG